MLGAGFPALDPSPLLQLVLAVLLLFSGLVLLVRRAASQYFVVDGAGFEEAAGREGYDAPPRRTMSIGGSSSAGGGADDRCATCGGSGIKKCSRCKSVRYCSQACQSEHWRAEHKFECKQMSSSDEVEFVSSRDGPYRRRKASEFSSISLVPARGTCKILQEPKKILFPYDEFLKLFNWDKPGFLPCGLVNCGNSCFANVVLQCLTFTRPLLAYLLERGHSRECVRKQDDWCFLCELQVHVQRASESLHPFQPMNILSRLPHIGGNLGYGRQEDAHEFMRFAIDTMQSVCLDEFGGEKALDSSTQETTLIQHIFGGHLRSQVICTNCNMVSNRYENMMDLTVEIHGDAESLEECLDQFTVQEWLDGENKYKCDGCNDYVKARKRLTVHQAPNILTVALKRFQSGRFGKLNKRVTFPEYLDLTPYMSGNADGSDLYTLYAVVVHVDMLNASFFGHYICYIKDFNGHWYRIDDCKVMNVDVEDVLAEGAYMLLYSRRSARPEPFIKPMDPPNEVAEVVPKVLGTLKEANSLDISCLRTDVNAHPAAIEASLQGNTEFDRKLSADVDFTEDKELEGMDLDVPAKAEKTPIRRDLGDEHGDAHSPKVASPISISCLPLDDNTQPTCTESSVPKDTGLCEKLSADAVRTRDKQLEEMDLDVPVEADSVLIHDDLGAVHGDAHSPRGASPIDVSCLPTDVDNRHGPAKVSMLRDAGRGEKLSTDIHNATGEGLENMDLDAPVEAHSLNISKDLGDVHRDAFSINLTALKGPEEGNSSLSSVVVDTVKCHEPFLSSDADGSLEEGHRANGILESSEVLTNTLDHSFTSNNFAHKIVDTPSNAHRGTASFVFEPSYDSRPKKGNAVTAFSPTDSASEVSKSLPTYQENGFSRKLKPLFSRGFLDRPAGKKSLDSGVGSPTESGGAAPKINGYSNAHIEIGVPKREDTVASLESLSRKNFGADGGVSFVSRGFLERSYKRSYDMAGFGRKQSEIFETNCNGSADKAPLCLSDSIESRLETSFSNSATVIETEQKAGFGRKQMEVFETNGNGSADRALCLSDSIGIRPDISFANTATVIETERNGFSDAAFANGNCRV